MSIDHELRSDRSEPLPEPPPPGPPAGAPVGRVTVVWYSVVAAGLFGWFLFGWLVLRQGFVDSVGESAGSAFALLLVVSIVGTLRQSRRR
jgi:hypothetical protein